jgi:hypothetical protein
MAHQPQTQVVQPHGIPSSAGELFPAGLVGQLHTHDLQEMYEAVPASWSEEWSQLGYGRFGARLLLCCTSQMVMARASWTLGLSARGPRGRHDHSVRQLSEQRSRLPARPAVASERGDRPLSRRGNRLSRRRPVRRFLPWRSSGSASRSTPSPSWVARSPTCRGMSGSRCRT